MEARRQVRRELERVRPGETPHHADGEIRSEDGGFVRIVVTDGGCAAEKIADAAPPEASFARNLTVFGDGGAAGLVDVFGPFEEVLIAAATEPREKREFEMVVSVDEAGENEESVEIKRGFRIGGEERVRVGVKRCDA